MNEALGTMQDSQSSENTQNLKKTGAIAALIFVFLLLLYFVLRSSPAGEGAGENPGTGATGSDTTAGGGGAGAGSSGGGGHSGHAGGIAPSPIVASGSDTNAFVLFNPLPPSAGPSSPKAGPDAGTGSGTSSVGDAPVFMGLKGKGTKYVFIVDKSGSMFGRRFQFATDRLIKFINGVNPNQEFQVFFYNHTHHPMPPANQLIQGNPQNKNGAIGWIRNQTTAGGTNPLPSIKAALALNPDTIWLLSDGQFPNAASIINTIRGAGTGVMINTIAVDVLPGGIMHQIASITGGQCQMRSP